MLYCIYAKNKPEIRIVNVGWRKQDENNSDNNRGVVIGDSHCRYVLGIVFNGLPIQTPINDNWAMPIWLHNSASLHPTGGILNRRWSKAFHHVCDCGCALENTIMADRCSFLGFTYLWDACESDHQNDESKNKKQPTKQWSATPKKRLGSRLDSKKGSDLMVWNEKEKRWATFPLPLHPAKNSLSFFAFQCII